MTHPFLENLAKELAEAGVVTLRYQFPYIEERRRVPDKPEVLTATVAAAVRRAAETAPELLLLAGGKSMGGRMTSQAFAQGLLKPVQGLVFFGFPLHPPNRPGTSRAEHLAKVNVPMLFLEGTRDTLADITLLRSTVQGLGRNETLAAFDDADHSFHVPAKTGRKDADVMNDILDTVRNWMMKLI